MSGLEGIGIHLASVDWGFQMQFVMAHGYKIRLTGHEGKGTVERKVGIQQRQQNHKRVLVGDC